MTTAEALRVSLIDNESERQTRECGLIAPEDMSSFACVSLEQYDLDAFDRLSEMANGGLVAFRDRLFRIDDRLENGNMIRSVVEPIQEDMDGKVLALSRNHIAHKNGQNYFHVHFCEIMSNGDIREPAVGSEDILKGEYQDMILAALIAHEGTALPLAA